MLQKNTQKYISDGKYPAELNLAGGIVRKSEKSLHLWEIHDVKTPF